MTVSKLPQLDLRGRVALVTGSSRGIGAAIAATLARDGAAVAVHGRDGDAVETVRSRIAAEGGTAIGVTGDLAAPGGADDVRRRVERELGPVDVLVANAGGNQTPPAPLEDIPDDGWLRTVDANLTATFLTLKAFLPGMKSRRRGAIVTISSAAARRPTAWTPIAYAAAKAGIVSLTQNLAAQAGPSGVRVNCICPETILTERTRVQIPAAEQVAMRERNPLGRLGTPDDVAEAALFLASDRSGWMTGVVLDVAGGAVLV